MKSLEFAMTSPNLTSLHKLEEQYRLEAIEIIGMDGRLQCNIQVVEHAMDIADLFRQHDTADEDLKVIQILGMRCFNAFGASLKLTLSGYSQVSALVMRDILEIVFLIDLFCTNRSIIQRWRLADKKLRLKDFGPAQVRKLLDKRDGFTERKRDKAYDLFCELAAHPNMSSVYMMRPRKNGNAAIGPFMEPTFLTSVLEEKGKLAVQVGELLVAFFPPDLVGGEETSLAFSRTKIAWINAFQLA